MSYVVQRATCCGRQYQVGGTRDSCPRCGKKSRGPFAWLARWEEPNGRLRAKTFRRRADAESYLTDVRTEIKRGSYVDPDAGKIHVDDYARDWLAGKGNLRPSTRARYEGLLRLHVSPAIGGAPLNGVRRSDVQGLLSAMTAAGLSPASVRYANVALAQIFKTAELDGLIGRSPVMGIDLPALQHRERRYLTLEEVERLADAIGPRYRALVLVGAFAALRWGEIAGLRVGRLRLLERRLDVVESITAVGGTLISGPPKRGAGSVPIPASIADELAAHLERHPARKDGLVFTMPGGGTLRYDNFVPRIWQPAAVEAGLGEWVALKPRRRYGGVTPHALRHAGAALAIAHGANALEVKELMRHSSIRITYDVYGHLLPHASEDLSARLDTARTAALAHSGRTSGSAQPVQLEERRRQKAL